MHGWARRRVGGLSPSQQWWGLGLSRVWGISRQGPSWSLCPRPLPAAPRPSPGQAAGASQAKPLGTMTQAQGQCSQNPLLPTHGPQEVLPKAGGPRPRHPAALGITPSCQCHHVQRPSGPPLHPRGNRGSERGITCPQTVREDGAGPDRVSGSKPCSVPGPPALACAGWEFCCGFQPDSHSQDSSCTLVSPPSQERTFCLKGR